MFTLILVGFPLILGEFQITLATRFLIFALLGLSLDLVWGYAGILDLGRAALFGCAAYVAALLATRLDWTSAFVVLPAAAAAGAVAAWLVGLFLFLGHRRDDQFFVAMALLGFTFIAERVATSWAAIGSANGIPTIPLMTTDLGPLSFGEVAPGIGFYFLVAGCLTAAYVVVRYAVRSQFGLVLVAARQDDSRAGSLGYPTARFRLVAYTASGGIAGLAGGLFAFHEGFVSPSLLGVTLSTQALLWVLLGGRGILIGAVVGALLLNYISFELSGFLSTAWQIVLGVIVVVGATVLPRGVLSPLLPREAFLFGRRTAAVARREGGDPIQPQGSMAL